MKNLPSYKKAKAKITYDQDKGTFTIDGFEITKTDARGQTYIQCGSTRLPAPRLAYYIVNGEIPEGFNIYRTKAKGNDFKNLKIKKGAPQKPKPRRKKRKRRYRSYKSYLRSPQWRSIQKEYHKVHKNKLCVVSGLKGRDMHHWRYEKDWNDDSYKNLIFVTREVHDWIHTLKLPELKTRSAYLAYVKKLWKETQKK